VFAPVPLIFVVLLVVAAHEAATPARGVLLGLVAAFFAGGLPFTVVLVGIRRGRLTDHHLTRREERPLMLAVGLASVSAGLAVLMVLDAPRALYALVVAMVCGVVVALVVTVFWKISIHVACAAGTVAVLVEVLGPPWLATAPLVLAVAWARITLRHHTPGQVLVGATVGYAIAAAVMRVLG